MPKARVRKVEPLSELSRWQRRRARRSTDCFAMAIEQKRYNQSGYDASVAINDQGDILSTSSSSVSTDEEQNFLFSHLKSNMKDFVCVKFKNKSTCVIYSQWMIGKRECRWPPSGLSVRIMAETKQPSNKRWKVYRCEVLCESNSYQRCKTKSYTKNLVPNTSSEESCSDWEKEADNFSPPTLARTKSVFQNDVASPKSSSAEEQKPNKMAHESLLFHGETPAKRQKTMHHVNSYDEMHAAISSMQKELTVISAKMTKMSTLLETIYAEKSRAGNSPVNICPAANEVELQKLIKNTKDYRTVAAHVQQATLRATILNFMKLFFKRELAVKFSWSGLGPFRKRTKISFQDHDIYQVFFKCSSSYYYVEYCKQN